LHIQQVEKKEGGERTQGLLTGSVGKKAIENLGVEKRANANKPPEEWGKSTPRGKKKFHVWGGGGVLQSQKGK